MESVEPGTFIGRSHRTTVTVVIIRTSRATAVRASSSACLVDFQISRVIVPAQRALQLGFTSGGQKLRELYGTSLFRVGEFGRPNAVFRRAAARGAEDGRDGGDRGTS